MLIHLLSFVGLVTCSLDKSQMIDAYLNQMMTRVDLTLNYALDKAFTETGVGVDWEILELKRDVIDQAQYLFRPMAKSILVESLQQRLQKRNDESTPPDFDAAEVPPADVQSGNPQSFVESQIPEVDVSGVPPAATDGTGNTQNFADNLKKGNDANAVQNSWNLYISHKIRAVATWIKAKLKIAYDWVLNLIKFDRIKAWFQSWFGKKTGGAGAAAGATVQSDPSAVANDGMFAKFKNTFNSIMSKNNIMIMFGGAFLLSLIYYSFFRIDQVDQDLDEE